MSPTFLRYKKYRFYVNSREETRKHIHVQSPEGELKVWLEPVIEIAVNYGFRESEIAEIIKIIQEKRDEFIERWNNHLG